MRMDRETAESMSETMNAAMAEMEKRLAEMPPEQREQMKQFMPEMMTRATGAAAISVDRTGDNAGSGYAQEDGGGDDDQPGPLPRSIGLVPALTPPVGQRVGGVV